jgi:hypothetical protein
MDAFKDKFRSTRLATEVFLARQDIKLGRWKEKWLRRRNVSCSESVLGDADVCVSMTTHGRRIETVFLGIESIGAGKSRPSRFILWLDDAGLVRQLPDSLLRLRDRGLEICLTENFGPHTKYYPYLISRDGFDVPLVTADDDVIYSRWWLDELLRAWRSNSAVVNCYRAHVIGIRDGNIAPYSSWTHCRSTVASFLNFATGVSGCIYPPVLLAKLKEEGTRFQQVCPKADDIWLHVNALRNGFPVRQILSRALNFPGVPETQDMGLFRFNTATGNDDQVNQTYNRLDINQLLAYSGEDSRAEIVPECRPV